MSLACPRLPSSPALQSPLTPAMAIDDVERTTDGCPWCGYHSSTIFSLSLFLSHLYFLPLLLSILLYPLPREFYRVFFFFTVFSESPNVQPSRDSSSLSPEDRFSNTPSPPSYCRYIRSTLAVVSNRWIKEFRRIANVPTNEITDKSSTFSEVYWTVRVCVPTAGYVYVLFDMGQVRRIGEIIYKRPKPEWAIGHAHYCHKGVF